MLQTRRVPLDSLLGGRSEELRPTGKDEQDERAQRGSVWCVCVWLDDWGQDRRLTAFNMQAQPRCKRYRPPINDPQFSFEKLSCYPLLSKVLTAQHFLRSTGDLGRSRDKTEPKDTVPASLARVACYLTLRIERRLLEDSTLQLHNFETTSDDLIDTRLSLHKRTRY